MKKVTWFLTDEFPQLLEKLEADKSPIWGKMTAHHMVEHLSFVLRICNGKMEFPVLAAEEAIAKSKRHVFEYKNPFPKGLKAPFISEDLTPIEYQTMEESKTVLESELQAFFDHFKGKPANTTANHPILGPLNFEEWAFFQTKHISHHFSQFGVMEKEITPY